MLASMPPSGVGGDQPTDPRRTGNFVGPSSSSRVAPSLQVTGSVYFSMWTSTPSARNAATAHSTALAISGEPVTRPPTSSVNRRRFSTIGDGPITCGKIFAAASAQDEVSVAEQASPWMPGRGFPRGSVFSWAEEDEAKTQRRNEVRRKRGIRRYPLRKDG